MENTNIVMKNIRLSYVHILKPYSREANQAPKYQATILLPKTDIQQKADLDAVIAAATRNGMANKWNGAAPARVPTPIWDGDGLTMNGNKFGPECKGCWVFTASQPGDQPIEVVDANVQPILRATEVYSGMYANVAVNFFAYNYQGKKGIGCGLGPVQKVADGEPLGGQAPTAKSVFSAVSQPAAQPAAAQATRVNPITGLPM